MIDHELATLIHHDVIENRKFSKTDARKKYGTSHSKLTRMESEGLIPKLYVMSKSDAARKAKAHGKGWASQGAWL